MTKICFISDTHGMHMGLQLPDADILVHCGDFSNHGTYLDAVKFVNWFGAQSHRHKVFIAGNHDLYFEQGNPSYIDMFLKTMPPSVCYLNDSGVDIEGIKFWGSPVQPRFFNWAFNRDPNEIIRHWNLIPSAPNIDVLVTHGPPRGYLDAAPRIDSWGMGTEQVGCPLLLEKVKKTKPLIHAFGHIHYSYGVIPTDETYFINASICNESYQAINKPILIDMSIEPGYRLATQVVIF